MTVSENSQRKIDAYLGGVRKGLRGMREEDAREIVEELRSHLLDKAMTEGAVPEAQVEAALAALGRPEELASQYLTDNLVARAQTSGSPLLIWRSLFRWASLSVGGFFILTGSLVSYFLGLVLAWAALLKPIHPETAGLWMIPQPGGDYELSLHMGFAAPPAGAHEILGWWIIPVGILGVGLFFATLHVDRWCLGKFRKSLSIGARS